MNELIIPANSFINREMRYLLNNRLKEDVQDKIVTDILKHYPQYVDFEIRKLW